MFRILVVDGNDSFRLQIKQVLESAGYSEINEASNGLEGMSFVRETDLVMTDLNMPAMGGVSFVREIRRKRDTADIPIIVITSENTVETVHRIVRLGVSDYLLKPFEQDVLIERVKTLERRNRGRARPA